MARRYGENLKRIREEKKITQEELMTRLKLKRQGPISLWETSSRVPLPRTITRHAKALDCAPGELLEDVETPYDVLRKAVAPSQVSPFHEPERRLSQRRTWPDRRARKMAT